MPAATTFTRGELKPGVSMRISSPDWYFQFRVPARCAATTDHKYRPKAEYLLEGALI